MGEPLLSFVMIVKDEAERLGVCLKSFRQVTFSEGAYEVVVVDTGSEDDTIKIALENGAKVYEFPWNGNESDARNESVRRARGRWVFLVDADEVVCSDLAVELSTVLPELDRDKEVQSGTVVQHNLQVDGSYSDSSIFRIFRRREGFRFRGEVHPEGNYLPRAYAFRGRLHHTGYAWTPEVVGKKGEAMLKRLEPYVKKGGGRAEVGRMGQYMTYLLILKRDDEFLSYLRGVEEDYTSEERYKDALWRTELANVLQFFSRKGDYEGGRLFAEEVFQFQRGCFHAAFYLCQGWVQARDWMRVEEISQVMLLELEKGIPPGVSVQRGLQEPVVRLWSVMGSVMQGGEFCEEKMRVVWNDSSGVTIPGMFYLEKEGFSVRRGAVGEWMARLDKLKVMVESRKFEQMLVMMQEMVKVNASLRWLMLFLAELSQTPDEWPKGFPDDYLAVV